MPILNFPNPRRTGPEGLLALGGDLHPDSLRLAYRQGIFPWPLEGYPLAWFCPPERAVLVFDEIHVPRSLERARKKSGYRFTIDQDFDGVIQACASVPRAHQGEDPYSTWITPEMLKAYQRLHQEGNAHSVEAWLEDKLVGGIYGVAVDGAFAGESMFYRAPNASKLALLHLVDHLRARGAEWIDIQMMTPHMEALGARVLKRDKFLKLLAGTQAKKLKLFP